MEQEVQARRTRAAGLKGQAQEPKGKARLEDLTMRMEPLVRKTKKGERTYFRRVASWREGAKTRKVYPRQLQEDEPGRSFVEGKKLKAYDLWN